MRKDYQFLIGHQFSVGGQIYTVRGLTFDEERTYVEAHISEQFENSETFSLSDVIQCLLVDEEIELFNPNYLAALDRAV
jgi:hypothetical protein